ncbi:MAG: hypothetical protein IBJ09_15695 [Bacteroidia bacterium]|nr:hypothetical protein [Bacteroidia bacterium]
MAHKSVFFVCGSHAPFNILQKHSSLPVGLVRHPVSQCDIFVTLADAAGISLPQDRVYDGVSLYPWIDPETDIDEDEVPHEALYWMADYNLAIRMGNFKLIVNTLDKTAELYDLQADRGEQNDIAALQAGQMQLLRERLRQWATEMPPMYWPRIMDYRIWINGKMYRWAV